MSNYDVIRRLASENNGVVTSKQAAGKDIDSWYFTALTRSGKLERVGRGIYLDSGSVNYDEMYFFQIKNKRCVFSYQSALFLHELTDRVPYREEVTVPQGYNKSRIKDKVSVHFIAKKWYDIGITKVRTTMGNEVFVYDMERTICDIIRDRKNQDPEVFSKAIHLYLKKQDKDIWRLREYARQFRIYDRVEEILEVVVSE